MKDKTHIFSYQLCGVVDSLDISSTIPLFAYKLTLLCYLNRHIYKMEIKKQTKQ